MTCGKHHGDGAAVGMRRYICLIERESIHVGSEAVGGGLETCVQSGNSLGLPHVEEVDGVDGGVAGKKADVLAPVFCRAHKTVEQEQGTPVAGALIVNLHPIDQDEGFSNFNRCMSLLHLLLQPLLVVDVDRASKRSARRFVLSYVTRVLKLVKAKISQLLVMQDIVYGNGI
jgi:hypothetical protein